MLKATQSDKINKIDWHLIRKKNSRKLLWTRWDNRRRRMRSVSHEFSKVLPLLVLLASQVSSTSSCVSRRASLHSTDSCSSSCCVLLFSTFSAGCCRACIVCCSCGLRARDADLFLDFARTSLRLACRRCDLPAEITIWVKRIILLEISTSNQMTVVQKRHNFELH